MDPEFIDFSIFVTFSIFSHSFFIASFPSSFFFFFLLFLFPPLSCSFSSSFRFPSSLFKKSSFSSSIFTLLQFTSLYFVLRYFSPSSLLHIVFFAFYYAHFSLVLSTFLHHSSCEKTVPFTFFLSHCFMIVYPLFFLVPLFSPPILFCSHLSSSPSLILSSFFLRGTDFPIIQTKPP